MSTDRVRQAHKRIRNLRISGRRWFQRSYGNTYHTARAWVNGEQVASLETTYGYGDQYLHNMMDLLERAGIIPERERSESGMPEPPWRWAQRHNIALEYEATDVSRKRDL